MRDGIARKLDPGPPNSSNLYEVPEEELRERKPSFRLAHTVVGGDKFPDLTFSEMLQATMPDRFSE